MGQKIGTEKAEAVFRRYADMIYRVALHNLDDPADADDILQEVCLTLLTKKIPEDEEHLKSWLIRVTINKCRDLSRSFWRRNRKSIDDYEDIEAEKPPEIMAELQSLSESYRNIIYLYYYEEYTVSEIAQLLRMNVNTVKSGLRRARDQLKKLLTEAE
ncbi:RNA polymerase sigma factor [Ruminococcus sp.]|uniref:RNA polymerase sigma factor n=1 Tax=Ruminococcus sp. TaxID=41978 RepID=UPI00386C0393